MSDPSPHGAQIKLETRLSPQEILAGVNQLARPADEALEELLQTRVPFIDQVSRYIIFSGGKRLRPVLFLLAARAAGRQAPPRQAAIFEYLHAATLLHDDVVDEAGLRRGRPAARVEYGNDAVILVGDFLFSLSYSLAAEVDDLRFVRALTDCTTYMAEGQVLELIHTGELELAEADYLEVIRAKTAVLLAAACQMGAIWAQVAPEVVDAFYGYGMELGLAFQMVDDALDYVGTQHEFGKPVGHDLAEGKITLPFIHAREHLAPEDRRRLLDLAGRAGRDPQAVEAAKELVRSAGGVEATYRRAEAHALAAQRALEGAGPTADRGAWELMWSLPWYVLNRRH